MAKVDPDPALPCLAVRDVSIQFDGIVAVDRLSFDVPARSIVSLIGPNGAGKTTLLNSVSGFVRARGSVRYRDVELLGRPAHRRASLGIGRTFQDLQLFESMTLLDNVITGEHALLAGNVALDILRLPVLAHEGAARERALEILRSLGLERYADQPVSSLPFGVQKLAGVARALAVQPGLLLLDEPAAGLNHAEVDALSARITELRGRTGLAILLVEHNMRLVMEISDRIVVLDQGRKLMEGTPREVSHDPGVIQAYLGAEVDPKIAAEIGGGGADSG